MGSASSKAARTLPKTASKPPPSWAGTRTPGFGDAPAAEAARRPLASETRSEAIEKDSRDPQLLANLSRLGPVRVDHHMQTIRTQETHTNRLFRSRARSEEDAAGAQTPRNRLWGYALAELLDERKTVGTREEYGQLAERFGMDAEKLDSVARYVNSPSIREDSVKRVIGEDGEERVTMTAEWREPVIVNDGGRRTSSL
ncbi:hypothetical protein BV25DRAFT_1870471 [Artomyces pyxidatus]|uniref:Uncharacterized protein n=1 Tax=Artomyces pyxidatus TaxID=48021 RepID=A0ACB8T2D5_9AGAM|nr:hypothetical protein BV25DRAFT_1870471 [Artomyces pyxidatus]